MQNNIRNTNLRFNLGKEQQRRAWEYLQTMDRQDFKSYSQVISLALVDYFGRYYRTQADSYLETREREELFVKQNGRCVICGCELGDDWSKIHTDHMVPWDLVGDELEDNFQDLCEKCNEEKNASTNYIFLKMIGLK